MLTQIIKAVIRELLLHRAAVVACFSIVSLFVLAAGFFWPTKFESQAVIFADESNIIKPLLEGSAQTTKVVNRSAVVREVIESRRLLTAVVTDAGLLKGGESPSEIEEITNRVRANLDVSAFGSDQHYIKIGYVTNSADVAYKVTSTITDGFLKDSADTKRRESREAYSFIDKQVNSYKNQLQTAEQALKEFNAQNIDGTEDTVNARIDTLRSQIEETRLNIESLETRRISLESQVARESKYSKSDYRTSVYLQQIANLKSKLETLKLSLTDTHPDVVNLSLQIADLEKLQSEDAASPKKSRDDGSAELNPLYNELRSKLADVKVDLQTNISRLASTEKLLEAEFERRKRIASSKAELAELTRDYTVTKGIYEDMLERKEKARLSMTLDIEGQGVSYKIQEPAAYPLTPIGLRFLHFFIAGPILGILIPLGFFVVFLQFDTRIRFVEQLKDEMQLPVLASVPHVVAPLAVRLLKRDMLVLGAVMLSVIATYVVVALIRVSAA